MKQIPPQPRGLQPPVILSSILKILSAENQKFMVFIKDVNTALVRKVDVGMIRGKVMYSMC